MILDSSALLSVLFDEPEREAFLEKIGTAPAVGVGAPTLVETAIVLAARRGDPKGALRRVVRFAERGGLVIVAFEAAHWPVAVEAWFRFGKGRHPAALNYGDCLAYATARVAGEPLLAKGDDFARTDLALA